MWVNTHKELAGKQKRRKIKEKEEFMGRESGVFVAGGTADEVRRRQAGLWTRAEGEQQQQPEEPVLYEGCSKFGISWEGNLDFSTNCIHSDLSQRIQLPAFCVRSEMLA